MRHYTHQTLEHLPSIASAILVEYCHPSHPSFCSFLLDCSVNPLVISLAQIYGQETVHNVLFDITRTWIYVLHRERLKLRGVWKRAQY